MMNYLLKLTPLEPFSFGVEKGFRFDDTSVNSTYFVRTKEFPEQTTIFGLVRYLVLEKKGLLKSSFSYTSNDIEKISECIGKNSFSFLSNTEQDFGSINSISPTFIIDNNDNYYIKNPFNNKTKVGQSGYNPILMGDIVETSFGNIRLPQIDEYNPKEGYGSGYMNITTGEVDDLFRSIFITGNCKNKPTDTDGDEDALFKREFKILRDGFSFATFVDADDMPENGVCYLGAKKSAFKYQVVNRENDLVDKAVQYFADDKNIWFYALSDIYCEEIKHKEFCIVESKSIRNLETVYSSNKYLNKRKKSDRQFNLIEKGSTFYNHYNLKNTNLNCSKIGYNVVIQLGGK